MDCRTARLLLHFAPPRPAADLEASEAEALESHLADCPDCGTLARAERLADNQLRTAMNHVPVPEGLRDRLLIHIQAERATWTRRWFYQCSLTAAAVLLLAVGLGLTWMRYSRTSLEMDQVLQDAQATPAAPEGVEDHFAVYYGIRPVPPGDFNYALLAACALGKVQGKEVPELLFVRGQAYARVYILTSRQFDFQAALAQTPVSSGGYTVELRPHPTNPNIAYLIVYRGGPLDWFLAEAQQPTA